MICHPPLSFRIVGGAQHGPWVFRVTEGFSSASPIIQSDGCMNVRCGTTPMSALNTTGGCIVGRANLTA